MNLEGGLVSQSISPSQSEYNVFSNTWKDLVQGLRGTYDSKIVGNLVGITTLIGAPSMTDGLGNPMPIYDIENWERQTNLHRQAMAAFEASISLGNSDPEHKYAYDIAYNVNTYGDAALGLGSLIKGGITALGKADDISFFGATNSGAMRSEAAANIIEARSILRETRPDLTASERNQIIKAFDLESFRVTTLDSPLTEFRYFDGLENGAGLSGRWSTPQWLATPSDRITTLALPNNQATRAATVTLQPGTTVFQGTVAPQFKYGSNLTGGGSQTYNVLGPRAVIKEVP